MAETFRDEITLQYGTDSNFIQFFITLQYGIEKLATELVYKIHLLKPLAYGVEEIWEDLFQKKEKFLSDYNTLRFLKKDSTLTGIDISQLLTSLSNLLRKAEEYKIDEIFLFTLRLVRVKLGDKTVFVITSY